MTRNGRRYLEQIIEDQAAKISQLENLNIELRAKNTSLENTVLAHRCTIPKMFRQFFGYTTKH